MSDRLFLIRATFSKVADDPSVLNFEVACGEDPPDEELPQPKAIGFLRGALMMPGYLPVDHDDWYFDAFDMRSAHAAEAFAILVEQRPLIGKALPHSDLLELGGGVALLERLWVAPEYRGKRLALRLVREAKHLLARYDLLVMLKAHPDGDNVTSKDCVGLANYYRSDERLQLKELSRRKFPGWLVAHWDWPEASPGDEVYWNEEASE